MTTASLIYGHYHAPELRPDQIRPADPGAHPQSHQRLSTQCATILAAFRCAPGYTLTNTQLAQITHRFSARLYDIRKAGIAFFNKIKTDHETGVVWYRMVPVEK